MKPCPKNIFKRVAIPACIVLMLSSAAYSETVTQVASMEAAVTTVFSLEFYTDANILYSTSIPFTNIDPTTSLCYADGRSSGDGKSDTGVLCRSNMNVTWYLKMSVITTSSPPFPLANFKYYMGQPWNMNTSSPADGTLAQSPNWYSVPTAATAVYTAGTLDKNNAALGTLATLSFAINPSGIYG